jgi:hypothetical protein
MNKRNFCLKSATKKLNFDPGFEVISFNFCSIKISGMLLRENSADDQWRYFRAGKGNLPANQVLCRKYSGGKVSPGV